MLVCVECVVGVGVSVGVMQGFWEETVRLAMVVQGRN